MPGRPVRPSARRWVVMAFALLAAACASSPAQPSTAVINDWDPEFSPDGTAVVFTSDRSGEHKVYLVNIETRQVSQLTDGRSRDSSPTWSADGSHIAYVALDLSADPPVLSELRMVDLDGTPREVAVSGAIETHPDVNTDGEIAMACGREQYDICIRDADLTLAAFVVADSNAREWKPAWSPDGTTVAYTSDDGGHEDIWLVDMEDGSTRRLTHRLVDESDPAWSPDGSEIAFTRQPPGVFDDPEVWVMDTSGRDQRYVTVGSSPSWSPDGTMLVVQTTPEPPQRGAVIELVDLETGRRTQISR